MALGMIICWPPFRRVMISWPPKVFVMYLSGWVVARLAMLWSCCWYSRMVGKRKGRFPLSSNTGCSRRHSANSGVDVRLNVLGVVVQWCMCQPGVAGPRFGRSLGVAKPV